ncbi:putative malate:quinone oxidoreductase 2 [compost metagenome]
MLEILERCFPQNIKAWEPKIKEMIPSYGISLAENVELLREINQSTAKALGLSDEKQTLHV